MDFGCSDFRDGSHTLRDDLLIPKTVHCSLVFFHLCLSAPLFGFFFPFFSKQHLQTEPSVVSQEGKHSSKEHFAFLATFAVYSLTDYTVLAFPGKPQWLGM